MQHSLFWRHLPIRKSQMLDLDVLFSPQPYDHPRLRKWRLRKEEGAELAVEVRRSREGLVTLPAELYVCITRPQGKSVTEREPWEYGLDLALVGDGVRATDRTNEGKRFALLLRELLRPIETRFGTGFFNGVFVELVRSSGLDQHEVLARVLKDVNARPIRDRREKEDCAARIRAALSQCATWLTCSLRYPREEAEDILASAVAEYLDERFSVTNRKLLGW